MCVHSLLFCFLYLFIDMANMTRNVKYDIEKNAKKKQTKKKRIIFFKRKEWWFQAVRIFDYIIDSFHFSSQTKLTVMRIPCAFVVLARHTLRMCKRMRVRGRNLDRFFSFEKYEIKTSITILSLTDEIVVFALIDFWMEEWATHIIEFQLIANFEKKNHLSFTFASEKKCLHRNRTPYM